MTLQDKVKAIVSMIIEPGTNAELLLDEVLDHRLLEMATERGTAKKKVSFMGPTIVYHAVRITYMRRSFSQTKWRKEMLSYFDALRNSIKGLSKPLTHDELRDLLLNPEALDSAKLKWTIDYGKKSFPEDISEAHSFIHKFIDLLASADYAGIKNLMEL